MTLTDEQKTQIEELFKQNSDLKWITQEMSGDPEADGRSKMGRAIRAYLREVNKEYETTFYKPKSYIELTDQQKEFLMGDQIDSDMRPIDIARLVFEDPAIQPLQKEHKVIVEFLKTHRPDVIDAKEILAKDKWTPPKALSRAICKINDLANGDIVPEKPTRKQERLASMLLKYLQSPRFCLTINGYSKEVDRELFEAEFVRATWSKPDLTNDELNAYVTVCTNYVRLRHIQQRLDKLNNFLDSEEAQDVTMRVNESIKATSEELNQCEKRIESMVKDLNGSRKERLKQKGAENGSILALIEAFSDEEERKRMIMTAQMNEKSDEEEFDRLESLSEFKVRVLGISKEEII